MKSSFESIWSGARQFLTMQSALCVASAGMLIAAGWRHPYGFYTVLRILVCFSGAYVAWVAIKNTQTVWAIVFGATAVLFNPIVPIYLHRQTWHPIDLMAALLFAVGIFISARFDKTSQRLQ